MKIITGGRSLLAIALGAGMIVAVGSYAGAQTMGEYGATINGSGVAAEQGGGMGSQLGEPPTETGSALDRPSPLDSGNDPLSEEPSYLGDSQNSGDSTGESALGGSGSDSSGIQYAPTVQ